MPTVRGIFRDRVILVSKSLGVQLVRRIIMGNISLLNIRERKKNTNKITRLEARSHMAPSRPKRLRIESIKLAPYQ